MGRAVHGIDMAALWPYNDVMVKFSLRLPDDLWKALKDLAHKEQRSINAQIIYILMEYIKARQQG